MEYQSMVRRESQCMPGVFFTLVRMSFGRRIELVRRIRELAGRVEFLEAGKEPVEKLEAALLAGEIDRLYLEWGLARIEGLELDGQAATPEGVVRAGPEPLCREILGAVKRELGLSEDERKN